MANRAVGKGDDVPREVFELDKDERWQARLEEARARREVALREKAAGKPQPKRPKPWEVDGQDAPPDVDPIIQERGDDKYDFADRLESLKTEEKPKPETPAEPERAETKRRPVATSPTPKKRGAAPTDRPPAGEAIEQLKLPGMAEDAPKPEPTFAKRRTTSPLKPNEGVRDEKPKRAEPDLDNPHALGEVRAFRPPRTPSQLRVRPPATPVAPDAPDVSDLAARYAETLQPDPEEVPDSEATASEEPRHAPLTEPEKTARNWRAPRFETRRGIRPLGMAFGLLALSALPLTTVAPPLEKGPPMPVLAPFPVQPALGVTWSLHTRPLQTRSGEWQAETAPVALGVPDFEPPVAVQRGIAAPDAPATAAGGTIDWSGLGGPAALPVQPVLPAAGVEVDPPAATTAPPPPEDQVRLPSNVPPRARPERRQAPTADELREALLALEREADLLDAAPVDDLLEDATLPDDAPVPAPSIDDLPVASATVDDLPLAERPASPLRITILTPPEADKRAAEDFASDVPRRGHELVRVREVDFPISTRNLRYFHADDRAEAARLARDYDAELRDFTWFQPKPAEGTAELWLSGGTSSAEPAPVERRFFEDPVIRREVIRREVILPRTVTREDPARVLDRAMGGLADMLGNTLGLPRRGN